MGKPVINGDYAKPLYTRLYKDDRQKLNELVDSFPLVPVKKVREGRPRKLKVTDAQVVRIAIHELHKKRCKPKKK